MSIKNPKISVIIPVYNCEEYLDEAITSLLIQTYKNFEIIAINDGSTDNSLAILEKYANFDNRITIITQKNGGIVKALNNGLKAAKAEYIARMDGDDVSFPNRFADQVKILDKSPDTVLVTGNFEVISQSGEFLYREFVAPDNDFIQRAFYLRNAIAHGSVMFRKSVVNSLGNYTNDYGPTEDLDLWMKLTQVGNFAATSTPIYKWRVNKNGITSSNNSESIRQAKAHIKRRWQNHIPDYISRNNLIEKINYFQIKCTDHDADYKYLFLSDTCQIAVRLFLNKNKILGVKQFFAVMFVSKTGFKIASKKLLSILKNQLSKIKTCFAK